MKWLRNSKTKHIFMPWLIAYKAIVITSLTVEQHCTLHYTDNACMHYTVYTTQCAVYKICVTIYLYFITYFNRRLGTWLR